MNLSASKLTLGAILSLGLSFTAAAAGKHLEGNMKTASYIPFKAVASQTKALNDVLIQGGEIVKNSEPQTKLWFSLKESDTLYAIFDTFLDENGRTKHVEGKAAAALKEISSKAVVDGWDKGVVKNINNYEILSHHLSKNVGKSTEATYILLKAKVGQEKHLSEFLKGSAKTVGETEENTLFWSALKLNDTTFAIFDTYTDAKGRKAHFEGKVANALKEKSAAWVEGGWDAGVLKNVHNFSILSQAYHP